MTKEQEESIKILKEDLSKARNSMFFETSTAVVEIVLNLIQQIQEENKQKDKIIDEMAEYIVTLDIEEDICSKTENEHCDKMNFGECEDCIKQYFEKKVQEIK